MVGPGKISLLFLGMSIGVIVLVSLSILLLRFHGCSFPVITRRHGSPIYPDLMNLIVFLPLFLTQEIAGCSYRQTTESGILKRWQLSSVSFEQKASQKGTYMEKNHSACIPFPSCCIPGQGGRSPGSQYDWNVLKLAEEKDGKNLSHWIIPWAS